MVSRSIHSIGRLCLALFPVIAIFFIEALPNEVDKIISGKFRLDSDFIWCFLVIILSLFIYIDYIINKDYYKRMEVK